MRVNGAHPLSGSYTHVCTSTHTPPPWFQPVPEGDLGSSPSLAACSWAAPPTLSRGRLGGVLLFYPL